MGREKDCLKGILVVYNSIVCILGLAVLGIGVWSLIYVGSWKSLLADNKGLYAGIIIIASGGLVALIGFLGCCGALKQSRCLLKSYATFILLIFILEFAAGIFAFMKTHDFEKDIEMQLYKSLNETYGKTDKVSGEITKAVDWFQKNLKCCGAAGPDDWMNSKWFNTTSVQVPKSCCIKDTDTCNGNGTSICSLTTIYKYGCVGAVKNFVKKHLWTLGVAAFSVCFIQIIGALFALCLCKAIKKEMKVASA